MMKSAEDRPRCDLAIPVDRPMCRRIRVKGQMRSEFVVIASVGHKNLAKIDLAQDHNMIQAFSPDRADEPFNVSILPG